MLVAGMVSVNDLPLSFLSTFLEVFRRSRFHLDEFMPQFLAVESYFAIFGSVRFGDRPKAINRVVSHDITQACRFHNAQ